MVRVAVIAQTTEAASKSEQTRLKLSPGATVVRVLRSRRQKERRLAYELVVLPLARFPGLAADGDIVADIHELARDHGLVLGAATERVSFVKASTAVAEHLGVAAGTRVMKLDRVTSLADGAPVEWRIAFTLEL